MPVANLNLTKVHPNKQNEEQLTSLWFKYKNTKTISQLLGKNIVYSKSLIRIFKPLILEEIVLLAKNKDLNYPDIAKAVGIGLKTLREWMKAFDLENKFDLPSRPAFRKRNDSYDDSELLYQFLSLKSINEMKKFFHSSGSTITKKLQKLGIITSAIVINRKKVINHVKREGFIANFTNLLIELIYGCLLGDGCIRNTSTFFACHHSIDDYKKAVEEIRTIIDVPYETIQNNLEVYVAIYNKSAKIISSYPLGIFKYTANIKEDDWLNYLTNIFENCGLKIYGGIKSGAERLLFDRTIKPENSYWIESLASIELGKIETEWYIHSENHKRIKIVPRTLESITPNILLAWFVGDGSNSNGSLELSTLNLNLEDNQYLVELLHKVGIKSKVSKVHDKRINKTYYRIMIGRKQYASFMTYLNLADPDMLQTAKKSFPWKFNRKLSFKEWKSSA